MNVKASYTVRAEFLDLSVMKEFEEWLLGGHMKEVVDCGGESCSLVKGDDPLPFFECRYIFPSESALKSYIENDAPKLRKEGLDKFPTGLKLSRSIGTIIYTI